MSPNDANFSALDDWQLQLLYEVAMEYSDDALRYSWAKRNQNPMTEDAAKALRDMGYSDEQIAQIAADRQSDYAAK